jgi:PAS domain S-box-containing protein
MGFLGVARDVTERKRAQEALKRTRDELETRVKERTADLQKANELLEKQIEERIRAEEKLKESEEKYRGLFENSGDAVFIVDIETGIILDANQQAEKLTGRPRLELIGMHQSRLHPSEDVEYYKAKFQNHVKNELVFDLEAEVVKKDGSVVPVFISSNLIDLQGKKVIQGIFRDISKEKIISDLKGELASRKLIRRARAIIANHYKISDGAAMKLLQTESRKQSRKLKEVAQAVISSKFILD